MPTPALDKEGYLVDPNDWSEDWARETARALDVDLTDEHWQAIRFMRAFYDEQRVPADARFVMRHLSETRGAKRAGSRECAAHAFGAQAERRRQGLRCLDKRPSFASPAPPRHRVAVSHRQEA